MSPNLMPFMEDIIRTVRVRNLERADIASAN